MTDEEEAFIQGLVDDGLEIDLQAMEARDPEVRAARARYDAAAADAQPGPAEMMREYAQVDELLRGMLAVVGRAKRNAMAQAMPQEDKDRSILNRRVAAHVVWWSPDHWIGVSTVLRPEHEEGNPLWLDPAEYGPPESYPWECAIVPGDAGRVRDTMITTLDGTREDAASWHENVLSDLRAKHPVVVESVTGTAPFRDVAAEITRRWEAGELSNPRDAGKAAT